jgi:4-hydroxy-tetrahydrodipicolinate synthase
MLRDFQPRGFDVFAGTETVLLDTLRAGGAGCITATGNVNAGPIVELYRRWREDGAEARQRALNETRAIFQSYPMISAMKAAIAQRRGDPAWAVVRPPLVELNEIQAEELAGRLAALPQAALS